MSIARSSSVRVMRPATAGTRLMQTRTFIGQARMRSFSGSNSGRDADDARRSPGTARRSTGRRAWLPSTACSGGRYAIRRCLPSDGPAPADVAYDRRPLRVGDRRAVGERRSAGGPACSAARRSREVWSSTVSVQQAAAARLGHAGARTRVAADEVLRLDLGRRHVGLDHGVVVVELGAVGAVALLEPAGGAVDAHAAGGEAERPGRPPTARPTGAGPAPSGRRAPSPGRRRS